MSLKIRRHTWNDPKDKYCIYDDKDTDQPPIFSGMDGHIANALLRVLSEDSPSDSVTLLKFLLTS